MIPHPGSSSCAVSGAPSRCASPGAAAWFAVEDGALDRDALGTSPPAGVPSVFLEPVAEPVEALLLRWARTHGPFTAAEVAERFALVPAQVTLLLERVAEEQRLLRGEFRPGASGDEWCDPDVLRQIKRRTIARLRGQVAPVPREVLGRFLPAWHRVTPGNRHDKLLDAVAQLEGIPLGYQDLVRMILPARVKSFRAEQLDELGAMGLLVWVGHSPLRNDDGRIMLFRRERVDRLLIPVAVDDVAAAFDARHHTILAHLEARGASFHAQLLPCCRARPPSGSEAIWDLVWAGLITNDTFAALRGLAEPRRQARRAQRARHPSVFRPAASFIGGRWSLVRELAGSEVASTERAHAWGATLLERHGIVLKETAAVEALGGGFGNVYRVLRSMEDAGKLRRGYFIEGLGGAQFAYPGTVDRLRRVRDDHDAGDVVALAATDPANPFGWLLPWPELSQDRGHGARRATGAAVVLVDGGPVLFLDRNARRLRTFVDATDEQVERALPALRELARGGRAAPSRSSASTTTRYPQPAPAPARARGFPPGLPLPARECVSRA
jgi:ATP-dependent Lhr-like helicase